MLIGEIAIYILLGLAYLFAYDIKEPIWKVYLIIFIIIIIWSIVIATNPIRYCITEILYTAVLSTFGFIVYMTVYYEFIYRKLCLTSQLLIAIPLGLFGMLLTFLILYRRNYYLGKKKVVYNKKSSYVIAVIGTLAFGTLLKMLFSSFGSNIKTDIVALVMLLLAFTFGINIESYYRYIWVRKYKYLFVTDKR